MTSGLLSAIVQQKPDAEKAWRTWRHALRVFDDLTYNQLVLLPLLGRRLSRWTESDPEAARFRGIVRMAWTRTQVHLQTAAEIQQTVTGAGLAAAVTGPTALALRAESTGAVRAIPHFTLLVRRHDIGQAVSVLERSGWDGEGWLPDRGALDWLTDLRLTRGEEVLYLHWRVYPAVFHRAEEAEAACFARIRDRAWNRHTFHVLDAEHSLLERVTSSHPEDPVQWEADLSLFDLNAIDWHRVRTDVRLYGVAPGSIHPLARLRLFHKRYPDLPIPSFSAAECASRSYRPDRIWQEFCRQCAYRDSPADLRHFVAFLFGGARREVHRWQRRPSWK